MNRLTKRIIEKNVDGYVLNHKKDFTENTYEVIQKLGKLEDLEEQLGCPLDEAIDLLLKEFSKTDDYRCLTCINSIKGTYYGCDGNCKHKDFYAKKEIIDLIRPKKRDGKE